VHPLLVPAAPLRPAALLLLLVLLAQLLQHCCFRFLQAS
jgi:hypothetical protein